MVGGKGCRRPLGGGYAISMLDLCRIGGGDGTGFVGLKARAEGRERERIGGGYKGRSSSLQGCGGFGVRVNGEGVDKALEKGATKQQQRREEQRRQD